jgi:multidrug resistance protein, MATE family
MIQEIIKRNRSLIRESWAISWPMSLIMFSMFLIGLTDVYVAGKFGKEIQAAYGAAYQIYFIFSIIAFALTVGAVSVISRLFTSDKINEFRSAVGSSIIIALIAGTSMSVLSFALAKPLIYSVSIPPPLKKSATEFMKVYSLGLLFSYVLINTNGILRGCKMIGKSLLTMLIICILNIALIIILALRSPLGFIGIAYATVISTIIGCLLNFVFVKKLVPGFFRFSKDIAREIVSIGWPAGLMQVFWQLGAGVLYLIIGALPQNNIETMAAFTNGMRVESAMFLPAFAFNMAAAVIVGNSLGKNDCDKAFKAGIVTAGLGLAIVSVLSVLVIINARTIASFLSHDRVVVSESLKYIYISFFAEPIMAWGVILAGGLNGAGDTRGPMLIITLSIWLVRIPLAYFLGIYSGLGAVLIWWVMNLSIIVQTVFLTRRYFRKNWVIQGKKLVVALS